MMSHTDLPTSFWDYALETVAFTLNRVPSKSVQKTPHEMWTGRRPNMSFMKIWGCKAYVKHQMSTKLEPKSEKCTFVGYPKETKGYYFYNENKVFVARTGVFLEKEFLMNSGKGRNIELDEVQQQQVIEPEVERISQAVEENPTDLETQPLRRSTRERHEPERYGFLVTTHGDVILVDQDEPKTYQEAVASTDSEKWLEAMISEMDSMSENQVWTLVEPPEGIKPIGCKWVFKKKTDMDGNVQTYKGRLVAKGFRQIHGVDYDETFSPVAMIKSIRILLAVAAFHDYEIWQMDVKTAFLNGKLEEDVYMTQPEGFVTPEDARKVCKLQRSIYGLKQASRSWNLRFNEAIQEFGFIRNEDEPCVYKKFSGSIVSFLVLYVDDILIIGNDIPTLQSTKTWLSSCFSMKDLGEAAYILGVKIYRDRSRRLLGLSQSTYIDKVLKRSSMEESKRGFLPMRHGISLSKEMCPSTPQERERMSQIPYASAIGSIMYAMICTRPDLSYALSEEELRIKGYTDASFQIDKDDSRSQSGFVFCLNGGAVGWKSSKQDTVAGSTTEAEYIAASEAAKEAVWIKKFITELGVIPSISDAVDLYCDNNRAIAQAKEPRSHQRSKHILRRFHLIREIIDRGDVEICKVNTDDNIADPLRKPLAQQKHDRHTESLAKNKSTNLKLSIRSRTFTHQEVREFVKRICSRFAAYQGTQFLKQETKEYVIEEPVPDEPAANAPRADKDKFKKHMDDMVDVGCLMLSTMHSELQKQHENMMTEGTPVGAHIIKMMGYVQTLEKLGFPLKNELATDLILQSLPGSFKPFVLNFNMNEINKTLPQLLGMLRTAESDMKKDASKSILLVREAKGNGKKVAKSKGSGKTKAKGKNVLKPKGAISKDGKCFHCNKSGLALGNLSNKHHSSRPSPYTAHSMRKTPGFPVLLVLRFFV
ncbi:hypothetical protein V6N12_042485 [Hibiscus sabdariffa]|uniref:Reverse transcriptase Ty1/copia-type domain-containing protein n=1 Tax=Hibiscus sabdariffa TaxID=183260 RepID=A0ABR2EEX3_9ROSI